MGQKINPTGFRLPVTRNWTSRWYASGRDYPSTLQEDLKVRAFLLKKLRNASVARVLIERPANNARITIFTARPGIVIGKQGADIEALKAEVQKMMGVPVHVNIEEVRRPELDAQLIADGITQQLEKRVMFRRAMKRAMQNAMRLGALGIKVQSSGRLNGADIARDECLCRRFAPTSTTPRAKLTRRTVLSASRFGSTRETTSARKNPLKPRLRAKTAAAAARIATASPVRAATTAVAAKPPPNCSCPSARSTARSRSWASRTIDDPSCRRLTGGRGAAAAGTGSKKTNMRTGCLRGVRFRSERRSGGRRGVSENR